MGISLKYTLAMFTLVALAAIGLSAIAGVNAHGGGFQLTKKAVAGPYELTLGTIPDPPTVGEAILILNVVDMDTGTQVLNADVSVTPNGPEGTTSPNGTIQAGPDSYDPTLYEARAELDVEGQWGFSFSVSGQAGSGDALFSYDVKRASPIAGIITLLTLLAFLIVLGLSMRAFLKDRNKGQRVRRRKA